MFSFYPLARSHPRIPCIEDDDETEDEEEEELTKDSISAVSIQIQIAILEMRAELGKQPAFCHDISAGNDNTTQKGS